MDLSEKLASINDTMKHTKEDWVATKPDNPDLAIYLHFWRDDFMVAGVQCALDRDAGLEAGSLAAMGFSAQAMTITFESYYSDLPESPITHQPWQHLEMQYVSETYPDAQDKGWVDPCLTTTIHERGGGYGLSSVTYRIAGDTVEWGEEHTVISSEMEDLQGGGVMFEHLQAAMARPTLQEKIAEDAKQLFGLTDEESRLFHSDMATAMALQERGLAVAVMFSAKEGSQREQWLNERLGEPGS